MIITTGDLKENYSIIDTVFAIGGDKAGFFSSANVDKAFDVVKTELSKKATALGGNALINCTFDYRIAVDGKKQVIELWGYGTVVKVG